MTPSLGGTKNKHGTPWVYMRVPRMCMPVVCTPEFKSKYGASIVCTYSACASLLRSWAGAGALHTILTGGMELELHLDARKRGCVTHQPSRSRAVSVARVSAGARALDRARRRSASATHCPRSRWDRHRQWRSGPACARLILNNRSPRSDRAVALRRLLFGARVRRHGWWQLLLTTPARPHVRTYIYVASPRLCLS